MTRVIFYLHNKQNLHWYILHQSLKCSVFMKQRSRKYFSEQVKKNQRTLISWNHGFTDGNIKDLGMANWVTRGRASTSRQVSPQLQLRAWSTENDLPHTRSQKGVSSWLKILPIEEHSFALQRGAFRDAICFCYSWCPYVYQLCVANMMQLR